MMKIFAILVLVGVCYGLPVEEYIPLEDSPASELVTLELTPVKVETVSEPPKADSSDLKTDASNWWHSWYHNYYYNYPRYSYWHSSW